MDSTSITLGLSVYLSGLWLALLGKLWFFNWLRLSKGLSKLPSLQVGPFLSTEVVCVKNQRPVDQERSFKFLLSEVGAEVS